MAGRVHVTAADDVLQLNSPIRLNLYTMTLIPGNAHDFSAHVSKCTRQVQSSSVLPVHLTRMVQRFRGVAGADVPRDADYSLRLTDFLYHRDASRSGGMYDRVRSSCLSDSLLRLALESLCHHPPCATKGHTRPDLLRHAPPCSAIHVSDQVLDC